MTPYYADDTVTLHHGDALEVLRSLPDASVDAVVTDPPYGLEFMGKDWDSFKTYAGGNPNMKPQGAQIRATDEGEWQPGRAYGARGKNPRCRRCGKLQRGNGCCKCPSPQWDTRTAEGAFQYQAWCEDWAREAWRVLKPGGHLLAFGGTRTVHRLSCAVEDAGFEIRDGIDWLYASGFPKSLDVSKAIDKAAGRAGVAVTTLKVRLAELYGASGKTRARIDAECGFRASNYLTLPAEGKRPDPWVNVLPSQEKWLTIKRVIGATTDTALEAELDRFFAAAEREVIGYRSVHAGVAFTSEGPTVVEITAPATDEARRWSGWGTALKPAREPIVMARKPLAAPAVNVLSKVESELKQRGVTGEIRWTNEPASDAAPPAQQPSSSLTVQPPAAGTSAVPADESATANAARPTASDSAPSTPLGALPTPIESPTTAASLTAGSATPSSMPTDVSAPAAASDTPTSSPSTTSTVAAPPTDEPPTARSITSSGARDSLPDIESFAGIATGLTGSRAHVRIRRTESGAFVWPEGLPTRLAGGATVAANVLAYGTGALNIDACRVGMSDADRELIEKTCRPNTRGVSDPRPDAPLPDTRVVNIHAAGRWPSNVVLSHAPDCAEQCVPGCPVAELDRQSGVSASVADKGATNRTGHPDWRMTQGNGYSDSGGASRYFPTFRYGPSDLVFFPVESGAWQPHGDGFTRGASTSAGRTTGSSGDSSPTDGSGSRPTGQSPTDTRSTTGTTTPLTTTCPTSCASPPSGTTTTTTDCANSTGGSTALSSDTASGAASGSPSPSTTSGEPAPGRATASPASGSTGASGSAETATSSTPSGASAPGRDSAPSFPVFRYEAKAPTAERPRTPDGTAHPTVKPLDLMRWLVRLVTPPGGVVLEPFAGSGTTAEACVLEGFRCIAIEREAAYLPLIVARLTKPLQPSLDLFGGVS